MGRSRDLGTVSVLSCLCLVIPASVMALPDPSPRQADVAAFTWVLLISGLFAGLIATLYAGSILFRLLGMHDPEHSMALPRNSVRGLLTFLVFLILMTFIFYSVHVVVSGPPPATLSLPKADLGPRIEMLGLAGKITGYTERPDGIVELTYRTESEDGIIAYFDRILVALLGIASTIIGFYFGSRSTSPASTAHRA